MRRRGPSRPRVRALSKRIRRRWCPRIRVFPLRRARSHRPRVSEKFARSVRATAGGLFESAANLRRGFVQSPGRWERRRELARRRRRRRTRRIRRSSVLRSIARVRPKIRRRTGTETDEHGGELARRRRRRRRPRRRLGRRAPAAFARRTGSTMVGYKKHAFLGECNIAVNSATSNSNFCKALVSSPAARAKTRCGMYTETRRRRDVTDARVYARRTLCSRRRIFSTPFSIPSDGPRAL